MDLSKHLQKNVLTMAAHCSLEQMRDAVLTYGNEWYTNNKEDSDLIAANLESLGLSADQVTIDKVQEHILLHYYEKFIGLCLPAAAFREYLLSHIDSTDAQAKLQKSLQSGKGVLLATCHFGAVELMVPTLASLHLPITGVLRFKTPELSSMIHERAEKMSAEGNLGKVGFIEIGKPGSPAALEMAAVLRRKEILLSMFDEKTEYSVPVKLFAKDVWGGAGLDKILRFCGASVDTYASFLVRKKNEKYALKLIEVPSESKQAVQILFDILQKMLENSLEQWYFLHEEVPFVK